MQNSTQIGPGGRVVIPAQMRRALGLQPGDEVVFVLEADGLRLMTRAQALEEARRRVRRYVPADVSLVEELLHDRREESSRG